jgi:hypothetical protein
MRANGENEFSGTIEVFPGLFAPGSIPPPEFIQQKNVEAVIARMIG